MIGEELKMDETELEILTDLKRNFRTYMVYEFMVRTGKCAISEIEKIVDFKLKNIYRIVNKLNKRKLIRKDFAIEKRKNGARYTIVAMPELALEVKKIQNLIIQFFNDVTHKTNSFITKLRVEKEN